MTKRSGVGSIYKDIVSSVFRGVYIYCIYIYLFMGKLWVCVCMIMYVCPYVCLYVCMHGWMDGSMDGFKLSSLLVQEVSSDEQLVRKHVLYCIYR